MFTDRSRGTANEQSYNDLDMIYIFDMILRADEYGTISLGHRGLHQRSDVAIVNELFDPKRQHIP